MNRSSMIAVATFALMAFGAAAAAQADCGKCGAKHGKRLTKALKAAGVADDVQAKILALKGEHKTAKKALKQDAKAKKTALREALSAATLDNAKIDGLATELAELKTKMIKGKVEHLSKVSALLTAEQRTSFFEHMKKRGKKGKGKGCRCKH